MSRDCCVALPHGAMGLSAVCDCGISLSYSLTFLIQLSPFEVRNFFSVLATPVLLINIFPTRIVPDDARKKYNNQHHCCMH